ncbi:uncharacterized protein LOC141588343 [Silene latifolia]|uniref:uncharacterized protein LOC141588343 n=1 Tax=Silene latifolia TaxID=37657 RepID=UPI003D783DB6
MGCISNTWYSFKVNGAISGFFPGKSGIRQGDPLCPYLFVLSMEILSRSLRRLCSQPRVSYHPKCSRLNITHLIFADDLMIFVRGDVPSVNAVKKAISEFALISGLHANIEKTNIYFGGVPHSIMQEILDATGFSLGNFPFRYLGLPLATSKLKISMFDSLVTKIQKCIHHWSSHALSYAGRAQLLNSVIFGLDNFWCSSLLLPKEVIHHINKLSKDFFWNIPVGTRRLVFKNWSTICAPWSYGGFNIKDLLSWNQALWVWKLSLPNTGLWAHWIKTYVLKQESIWTVISKEQFPSCFKDILKTRDIFVSLSGSAQQAQLQLNAWCAGSHIPANQLYLFFRQITPVGDWATSLTYSGIMPSHRIISSMAVQGQLATVDNLQRRGFSLANRCCLCENHEETHAHLFFSCPYSHHVWLFVLQWMNVIRPVLPLQQELTLLDTMPSWRKHWFQVSIATVVHSLWTERNHKIFAQEQLSPSALLKKIKFKIAVRMHMRHSELFLSSLQSV